MNPHDDLKAYLDGELPAEQMAEMREAIEGDPMLAHEAKELESISLTLRHAAAQPQAVGLEETLRALGRAEPKERRAWWPWLVPVAAMAGALVFIVGPTIRDAKAPSAESETAFASKTESRIYAPSAARPLESGSGESLAPLGAEASKTQALKKPENKASTGGSLSDFVERRASESQGTESVRDRGRLAVKAKATEGAQVTKGPTPKLRSEKPLVTNARPGTIPLRGKSTPLSTVQNYAIDPEGAQVNEPAADGVIALNVTPVETIVVEVDSPEDAEAAIRGLADRMGATVYPSPVPTTSAKAEWDQVAGRFRDASATADRRLSFEVVENRVAEAKKRVADVVREATRLRREATQTGLPSGFGQMRGGGGGGFGGGGVGGGVGGGGFGGAQGGGSQQSETQSASAKQNQTQPTQNQGPQTPPAGPGGPRGQSRQETQQTNRSQKDTASSNGTLQKGDATGKSGARDGFQSKRAQMKSLKRIEVILRIKPKPTGKLEE